MSVKNETNEVNEFIVCGRIKVDGQWVKVKVPTHCLLMDNEKFKKHIVKRAKTFAESNQREFNKTAADIFRDCFIILARANTTSMPFQVTPENFEEYVDGLIAASVDTEEDKIQFIFDLDSKHLLIYADKFPSLRIEDYLMADISVVVLKRWLREEDSES